MDLQKAYTAYTADTTGNLVTTHPVSSSFDVMNEKAQPFCVTAG